MSPYFIAKNISEIPLQLVYPTIFVTITYWMVGLNSDPGRFFSYLGLVLLANFTSMSLGLLLGALFVDMAFGSLMASVVMLSL
jgi:ABC-type multidrug transport system permease subunit